MAAARAVIFFEDRLLFVQRRANCRRSLQWCFPSGRIRSEESPEGACAREVREEVGLNVTVAKSLLKLPDQEFFYCTTEDSSIQLCTEESQAFAWAEPSSLLSVGQIMDLRIVLQVLRIAGIEPQSLRELDIGAF